jgi:hypothetical protein
MAQPHMGRIKLFNYLKKEYPWKMPFLYKFEEEGRILIHEFSWNQVNSAKKWMASINPENYKILMYLTTSDRSRQAIADSQFLNSSTVKRRADKAVDQIMQYLIARYVNLEDFDTILEPIDIRIRMEKGLE